MTRLATATKEYTNEGYLSQTIYVLIHYIYIYGTVVIYKLMDLMLI